jgi:O-antigen ligase
MIDIAFLGFYLYSIINLIFKNPKDFYNVTIIILLSSIILYFNLKTFSNFKTQKVNNFYFIFSIFILFSCITQLIWGGLQLLNILPVYDDLFKITGSFINPTPYAYYVSLIFIFALSLICFLPNNKNILKFLKIFSIIVCIGTIIILPFTKIRMAWIMTAIGTIIILNYKFKLKLLLKNFLKNPTLRIFSVLCLLLILIISGLLLYKFKEKSSDGRILVWKVSEQMIIDNPIFGIGYNRFENIYNKYQAQWFYHKKRTISDENLADTVSYTYNEFYQILIENGIVGFILFIVFLFLLLKKVIRYSEYDYIKIILFTFLICFLICAFFSYPFRNININTLFIIVIAAISSNYANNIPININLTSALKKSIAIVLSFCLLISIISEEFGRIRAYIGWYKVQSTPFSIHNPTTHIEIFNNIYPVLKCNGFFLCSYGEFLLDIKDIDNSIKVLNNAKGYLSIDYLNMNLGDAYKAKKDFKNAEIEYQIAKNIVPGRLEPNFSLMQLYDESGQIANAKKAAFNILLMHPKVNTNESIAIKNEAWKILKKYAHKLNN